MCRICGGQFIFGGQFKGRLTDEEKAAISTTAPDITVAASQSIDEQDGGIRVADIEQQMYTDFLD